MTVLFGFASADITPYGPVRLGGYVARAGESEGVADGLSAQVLAFWEGERRLVLVSLDLLGLDRETTATLSERLAGLTGLHADDFEVCCTHTHSGPNVLSPAMLGDVPVEREYLDALPKRLAVAVEEAVRSEAPLEAGWATGEARGVGASRLAPGRKDMEARDLLPVLALRFNEVGVFGFGCHPTVLGHDNLLVSGDLFGAARRGLEERLNGPCVILQGAAADISARSTRREQTLRETRRLGELLADAATAVREGVKEVRPVSGLRVRRTSLELPIKALPSPEEARLREREMERELSRKRGGATHAQTRLARTSLEGARVERRLSERVAAGDGVEAKCEIFAARIGTVGLLGVGGELASGLGAEISSRSPLRPTVILGCCGGYAGYILGFGDSEGYESLASPFAPEAGEVVVEGALRLLGEVAAG